MQRSTLCSTVVQMSLRMLAAAVQRGGQIARGGIPLRVDNDDPCGWRSASTEGISRRSAMIAAVERDGIVG